MSEIQEAKKPGRKQVIVTVVAILAGMAVLYGAMAIFFKPQRDLNSLAVGHMAKLSFAQRPQTSGQIAFQDASGKTLHPADFKGRVVVVNLWATWCGPCKIEMPTLARLQAAYAGKPVTVAAVSTDDDKALAEAKAFIAGNAPLAYYGGGSKLAFQISPPVGGFPTTVIFDRSGKEVARMSGEADWSSPEARAVIDRLLAE